MISDLSQTSQSSSLDQSIISPRDMTQPSGTDQSIPYVISPRNTFLDTRRPKLRWNKVEGATSYTVKIVRDYSEIVWQREVNKAEFNSSEDLPLKPGVDYSLIVESDNGRSSEMDLNKSKLKFQLLDEGRIRSLPDAVKKIANLGLTDDEETLELANLYFGEKYGLLDKATKILEQRITAKSQTSEIYVEVGNLYRVFGLCSLAEGAYRKALKLVKPGQELEEQIIAKAGLAEILTLLGNEEEADRLKQQIKTNREALLINRQSRDRAKARFSCPCPNVNGKKYGPHCIPNTCIG